MALFSSSAYKSFVCLALVAHAVIQALGRTELEDGTRTGVSLKRLHAQCGVCTLSEINSKPFEILALTIWGCFFGYNKVKTGVKTKIQQPNSKKYDFLYIFEKSLEILL